MDRLSELVLSLIQLVIVACSFMYFLSWHKGNVVFETSVDKFCLIVIGFALFVSIIRFIRSVVN